MPLNRTTFRNWELTPGVTTLRTKWRFDGLGDPTLLLGDGLQIDQTGVGIYTMTVTGVGLLDPEILDISSRVQLHIFSSGGSPQGILVPVDIISPRQVVLALTASDFNNLDTTTFSVPGSLAGTGVSEFSVFKNAANATINFANNGELCFDASPVIAPGQVELVMRRRDDTGALVQTYDTFPVTGWGTFSGPTWTLDAVPNSDVFVPNRHVLTLEVSILGGAPNTPPFIFGLRTNPTILEFNQPTDAFISVVIKNSSA